MSDTINIKIDDNLAHVKYTYGGVDRSKILSLDTLVSAFTQHGDIKTPLLPPGCRYYRVNKTHHSIYLEVPPCVRTIKYINRDQKVIFQGSFPCPWTLMELVFVANNQEFILNDSRIFSALTPITSLKTDIYHSPYPNVFNDTRICWGNNKISVSTLAGAGIAIDYFFSANFNTDLHPSINSPRFEDMARDLKDKQFFDPKYLKKYALFESIIGGRR
jgi:hypothetical protein